MATVLGHVHIAILQERYRKLGQRSDKTKQNRIGKQTWKVTGSFSPNPSVGENSSQLTRKGPCSVRNPSRELQPGPPLSQSTTGLFFGSFCDSTNLGRAQGRDGASKRPRPALGR